jgi:magnesium transporter
MLTNFGYNRKGICQIKNSELKKFFKKKENKIWIKASNISKDEEKILQEIFGIHPITIEDISSPQTRVKYEEFEEYTLIIFKGIKEIKNSLIENYNISFIIGKKYIITINDEANEIIEELSKNEKKIENFLKKDEDYIAHYVLDKEVDKYLKTKIELGEVLKKIEREFAEKHDKETLRKIFAKELLFLEFRQLAESITDVCLNLTKPADNYINNNLIPYFRDVHDHAFRTTEGLKTMLGRINGMRNIYMSISSMKMNETIRALTIIMALMMPLTIITGFYGMNIELPFQKNPYAYMIIGIIMMISSIVMIILSGKKGWFGGEKFV